MYRDVQDSRRADAFRIRETILSLVPGYADPRGYSDASRDYQGQPGSIRGSQKGFWRLLDMESATMIVKIQRNLVGPSSVLIYDKPVESTEDGMITDTHRVFSQISMPEHEIIGILGADLKGYFEVQYEDSEGGAIHIKKRVPDQDW